MTLWANADFRLLWSAATISTFGSLITRTALPFAAILTLDASPLDIGLLTIAELAPGFVIGLIAGAWIDRLPRRPILIVTDFGRAVVLLTIPATALVGALTLVQLYIVAAVTSLLTVCFDIAYQAYLPTLVDPTQLVRANSRLTAAAAVAETAAFSSGGWLVQLLTAPFAILIDSLTFVSSAFLLVGIHPKEAPAVPSEGRSAILTEIGEGLRLVTGNPLLRSLTLSNGALNLGFTVVGTVYLLYVSRELGFAPAILGMIFAVGGLSSLLGATLADRLGGTPVGPMLIFALAMTALGLGLVPLAVDTSMVAIVLLVAQQIVADGPATLYEITQVSVRQAITPDRLLGRVSASNRVVEVGAMLAGALLGGVLGERIGLRPTFVIGVMLILAASLALLLSPVRRLRDSGVLAIADPTESATAPTAAP
jgi:MFS family permease